MSSFLVLCEGNTRNRWRDGQVCPDVDKELWCLGPDGSGVFWRVMRKSDEGGRSGEKGRKKEEEGRERRTRRPGRENGRKVGRGGRVESGRKEKRERTEGVRDWSEKDDERRWR
ncbi:hypothetical protein TNCV_4415561 [Trichonephila clavipes]|uniref:Uncharacterized protein n=1 Tax=Trichonephila clavipes TaxID=2585209 RepID=A0A8X6S463_TRICX|nr:hypothetical protein TNCV_4415561 [Trichonephila clavipes]